MHRWTTFADGATRDGIAVSVVDAHAGEVGDHDLPIAAFRVYLEAGARGKSDVDSAAGAGDVNVAQRKFRSHFHAGIGVVNVDVSGHVVEVDRLRARRQPERTSNGIGAQVAAIHGEIAI